MESEAVVEEPSPSITVRPGDPDRDLEAVVSLNAFVQDVHATAEPSIFRPSHDLPGVESFHRDFMTGEDRHTFIAEVDGAVVGYVCVEVQRRHPHTFAWRHERLYVDQICVHPEQRRTGVGRALMDRVATLARSLGIAEVALDTWFFNTRARRFFESLGYTMYNVRMRKKLED